MTSKVEFGFLGLLLCASSALAGEIPDYPFVFVVGKADTETPPNIATCSLTLRAREQSADMAASIVEDRLKTVLATLTANHVAPGDIESFNIQKQVLTNENEAAKQAVITGYDVWRSLKFTARKLESIAPVEASLVKSANIVDISCQFDRTDRSAIEAELLTKALHTARNEADKMAEPLGRHVTAVVALSKVPFDSMGASFGFGDRFTEMTDRMFKRSASPGVLQGDDLLVPSTIHVSVSVNTLFKME